VGGELVLLLHREQPVAGNTEDQGGMRDGPQNLGEFPAVPGDIVGVHRVHQDEIAVGVKASGELVAVEIEVALHREATVVAQR
jgi:hypothetical protein